MFNITFLGLTPGSDWIIGIPGLNWIPPVPVIAPSPVVSPSK